MSGPIALKGSDPGPIALRQAIVERLAWAMGADSLAETRNVALILGLICAAAGVFVFVRAKQVADMTDASDGGTHRAWVGHVFIIGAIVFSTLSRIV